MTNHKKAIDEFKKLVENTCKKKSNYFGYAAWTYHINTVIKFAKILSNKLKADNDICEIAAIFHDYASVKDKKLYPQHHIHSARLAEEILRQYNFPEDKIKKIKHCIYAHRGSKNIKKESLEAQIVASADSMSHFKHLDSLLYLSYAVHKMDIATGKKWVLDKLQRSYRKLMPEAKQIIEEKYIAIKKALSDDAKR